MIFNVSLARHALEKYGDYPRTDTHAHTYYSDGCATVYKLVKMAKKRGFPVMTKTDHNTVKGNDKLKNLCKREGIIYVPGVELSTKKGHMVVLNIEDIQFTKGLQFSELVDQIHERNGIAVMAHPWWGESMREDVFEYEFLDGFEGLNGSSPFGNLHFMKNVYPKRKMTKLNPYELTPWAGSDSHAGYAYGMYFNIFLTTDNTKDGILEAMRKGNLIACGPFLPLASFLIDGAINQPIQLKKELFYKNKK